MRNVPYTSKIRNKVFSASLKLDRLLTLILSDWLEVDPKISLTLGNKSTALSFRSKVELLIDLNVLSKASKTKFIKFMEIRNQFAHNMGVDSFSTCYENIDGILPFLKKNFQLEARSKKLKESDLEQLFDKLSDEVLTFAIEANKVVRAKKRQRLEMLYKTAAFDTLIFSVENMAKVFLKRSEDDSSTHLISKRMIGFVEAAKRSLYENVIAEVQIEEE